MAAERFFLPRNACEFNVGCRSFFFVADTAVEVVAERNGRFAHVALKPSRQAFFWRFAFLEGTLGI